MGFHNPMQARLRRDLKTQRQLGLPKHSHALLCLLFYPCPSEPSVVKNWLSSLGCGCKNDSSRKIAAARRFFSEIRSALAGLEAFLSKVGVNEISQHRGESGSQYANAFLQRIQGICIFFCKWEGIKLIKVQMLRGGGNCFAIQAKLKISPESHLVIASSQEGIFWTKIRILEDE